MVRVTSRTGSAWRFVWEFEELKTGRSWRRDLVREDTLGRRGPREALMNWGPEKMLIRCSKESQHPAEWIPRAPVEHQKNEKDTTLTAISLEVKILQLCSISSSLSRANLEQPFRTLAIKWEVNVVKEVFLRLCHCVRLLFIASVWIQYIYVYFCMNQKMTIQQSDRLTRQIDIPLIIILAKDQHQS